MEYRIEAYASNTPYNVEKSWWPLENPKLEDNIATSTMEMYIAYGEHLPTYKPSPKPEVYGDLRETVKSGEAKVLSCLTPHGKWHIHSTYMDNIRMLTLSRGIEPHLDK